LKKSQLLISLLSFALSSTLVHAQESPHVVGIQVDFSAIDTENNDNTRELNDLTSAHYTLSYQYSINEYFSVGAGYLNGDSSSFTSIVDIFTDSKLDYNALMLSAKAQYPISKRNSLYVQINALQYDYDIIDDNKTVFSDDGSDFGFSAGWKHQYDMGIGLKIGYDVLNLGDNITINGISVEASYRF
jgi:hypothetical protein